MLVLIHEEYSHRRIAENTIKTSGRISKLILNYMVIRSVLNRSIKDRIVTIIKNLKLHGYIVIRSIFSSMNGIEIEPFTLPL